MNSKQFKKIATRISDIFEKEELEQLEAIHICNTLIISTMLSMGLNHEDYLKYTSSAGVMLMEKEDEIQRKANEKSKSSS